MAVAAGFGSGLTLHPPLSLSLSAIRLYKAKGCFLSRQSFISLVDPSSSASSSCSARREESICMAAASRISGIAAIGKRVVSQIWSPISPNPPPYSLALRRAAHTSVYDKNPDDQVAPSVVPDEVIEAPSDKYWAPHPKTGVFGPATDLHLRAHGELPKPGDAESSVLEHTAWFRPTSLEDLEKPPHH